jgi:hypothetical protein
MKQLFLFFCFLMISGFAIGQATKSPIVQFLTARQYTFPDSSVKNNIYDTLRKWPDTLYYNTVYKAHLLGSATVPISFSSIELAKGNYEVSPTVGIGFGYTWFLGDFIFNENDKITIEPTFFFGLIANAGLENDLSFNKLASFNTGGFIGFGTFTLFIGYDFINRSPTVGLGGRIDFFTISQKYLHVFGQVHEVRKHKKIVFPITPD